MAEERVVRCWHGQEDGRRFREMTVWGDETLVERFDRRALDHPDKPAVVDFPSGREWTYGRLRDASLRLAGLLVEAGVRPGDIVAAQLPSGSRLYLLHLACNRVGALFMPLSTTWRSAELLPLFQRARPVVAIHPGTTGKFDFADMVAAIAREVTSLQQVWTIGELEEELERAPATDPEAFRPYRPSPDDPAHVMVTSGTTGLPKASIWSSNNLVALLLAQFRLRIGLRPDDVAGGLAPANTGSTGYAFPGLAPLLVGASFVMLEDWDPEAGLEMLSRYRCTYATAIPTQMVQLLQLPLERYDLGRLTRFNNAGAPLPPEAAKEIEERIGCRVQTLYGATDGGVPVTTDIADPAEKRRFTVGRRLPGQELKLVDPATGEDVRPGETGEVIWRGANKSYGYLNQPEYDAENWRDGWFRSGDLGVLDEEGYLRIVGRVKDMILRGGVNIFPKEIEDLLIQQPKVAQVVVAGAPDPVLGQRVAAFVVPRDPTSPPALEELNAFLSQRQVARWKHIEQLHVVSSIPLNSGGKVDKPRLLEMVAGERGATA